MAAIGKLELNRRTVSIGVLVIAVVAVITVFVAMLLSGRGDAGDPSVTITTTGPVPTPEAEPIARDTSTALLAALPDTVLGYAVSAQVADEAMVTAGAIEGWQLTYTGADGDVTVRVGQWESVEEAAAALPAVAALDGADVVEDGQVDVAGAAAGTFQILEAADGAGRAVWTNGTVGFVVDGPDADSVRGVYQAYPL
ncbi:hypothetical protein [Occultella gossypii]|uniref:Uncharacterized protein n=1 Tax=Occultella gossypii TaxID=2800820 RepID=A0ABS7SCH0_9MICO|nr:hypothetical protein [Occultella gossypii]MBZ2198063.1 hypothetical protein [Occultella gossypii]